jgi:hypothetical protein
MSLWNLFWTFATQWAPPLVALWLCIRAAISRDGSGRRITAVALAFLPTFLPLLAGLWVRSTGAPGGTAGTLFIPAYTIAPFVPAAYLLSWAFATRDVRWMRVVSAILGLIGICFPLFSGWLHLMR